MIYFLGIDTGGTFTDFVLIKDRQLKTHKVLSTPQAPEQAIVQGIYDLGLLDISPNDQLFIVHGSTVATNAVLEGKGVKTVFITNHGMGDLLTIGRQARAGLYNLQPDAVPPPVAKEYCLETGGRLSAHGDIIEPLEQNEVNRLVDKIKQLKPDAVAVNLLFSYLDDRFEQQILKSIPEDIFVSLSSRVLPEIKEYERGITTWLNAYVGPLVKGYISRLQKQLPYARIHVMQSAGTTVHADQAGEEAVRMLLSGPAGGLAAAAHIKQLSSPTHRDGLLTFDMGGTSTDVALIQHALQLTNEARIANYPVAVPMVDMHTIGAGGGSIASVDAGGLLQVGPHSAGAHPGPACYGKGGEHATVTDANLVLGRLLPDAFLGGAMTLDKSAAEKAVGSIASRLGLSIEETASGIIKLANDHMAQALRVMSVQRGIDPRKLTLTSFGGAGGLHVCALAESLQMTRAIIPMHSGVLSALGMLIADKGRHLSQTVTIMLDDNAIELINRVAGQLAEQGRSALVKENVNEQAITSHVSLDCRYYGQSYTLNVPWSELNTSLAAFHQLHETRYGHRLELPVEVVNVRVALTAKSGDIELPRLSAASVAEPWYWAGLVGLNQEVPVYARNSLACKQIIEGPALITETVATSYLAPSWQAEVDDYGNLILTRTSLH